MLQQITFEPEFPAWQKAARRALQRGLRPEETVWEEHGAGQPALGLLFEDGAAEAAHSGAAPDARHRVPREFISLAERVACHRDPRRWGLLYRVLWRLTHGEPRLLEVVTDQDVNGLMQWDKAVRRDVHKMRAFVRFRTVLHGDGEWYVAWFEPEHHIVERNAAFFVDRFAGMRWSILTPDRCAHWDGERLTFTPGVPKSAAPAGDVMEDLWRTYYGNIFNPARVKTKAMVAEMPRRYWKNLPEAAIIPALLEEAPARVERMIAASEARVVHESDFGLAQPPATEDWSLLREAAGACRACPLWRDATQTVFGEGPHPAEVMFLGEQPGDAEDRAGRPFTGPAGQLLDRLLRDAGLDRARCYMTNTVKHFKWEPRGRRRIHQTPGAREVTACRPWLEAEVRLVRPRILVCLGGTAASAVYGPAVRVVRDRGVFRPSPFAEQTLITYHPSALLRAPDETLRAAQEAQFMEDLRLVAGEMVR